MKTSSERANTLEVRPAPVRVNHTGNGTGVAHQAAEERTAVMSIQQNAREWFVVAERWALRIVLTVMGLGLTATGLALAVSMNLLPPGLLLGITGVGLLVWGVLGDLPAEP